MKLWAEIWSRPGSPTFGRVIDDPPAPNYSFHDGLNVVGDGSMRIPSSFDRFDEILLIDRVTPSNCTSSLVRIFSEDDPTTPIFEWVPASVLPTTTKDDANVDIAGRGIKSILGHARTEAFDWDGSAQWVPTFPDWIYGGDNILANPGFENSVQTSTIYELLITATGGTFTLSDGTDTTSAIAYNATESTIETRLETDITAIDDVLVTPIDGGFTIEMVNPGFLALTVGTGSLTGGSATLTRTFTGSLQPNPWTKSQQINVGTPREFGLYTNFRVVGPSTSPSGPVHSGSYSLWINPGTVTSNLTQFAGAQQVVTVDPGGTYQAGIWAYSVSGGDYRLVIRGIDEDLIAFTDVTLAATTWTLVTLTDVVMETPTGFQPTNVIFRFANIEASGTPSDFYLDDAYLTPGLAATTVGEILGDLYDDATTDHAGRVVWEDEANPGTPYLTLDFTDTLDSNGNAWDLDDISIKIWMRMSYLQVMEQFASTYGYEWRIVPDDVEAGTWLWQVYNPDTMLTDYTTAASPAIQGGARDTRRALQRFLPPGTDFMVEGLGRLTARSNDATLSTALGRIESSRLDRELPTEVSITVAAVTDASEALYTGVQYLYELTDPDEVPLSAYLVGDVLTIHDPPEVSDAGRLIDVEVTVSPQASTYETIFVPYVATSPSSPGSP